MDRRITLQRMSETDDGYGTVEGDWTDLATVWAKLMPLSTQERVQSGQLNGVQKMTFKIRRDSSWGDLNEKDRLLYREQVHNILGVREYERRFFMVDVSVSQA